MHKKSPAAEMRPGKETGWPRGDPACEGGACQMFDQQMWRVASTRERASARAARMRVGSSAPRW